jgi:hypothetical protein
MSNDKKNKFDMHDHFARLAELSKQRSGSYKNTPEKKGEVLLALFGGEMPHMKTKRDLNRFGILNFIVSKLIRYCENWEQPTTQTDSLDDLSVYSQILKTLDEEK